MKTCLTFCLIILAAVPFAAADEAVKEKSVDAVELPTTLPKFAVGVIGANGKTIRVRMNRTVVRTVAEQYVVKVPVINIVDGKKVTTQREEKRTRTRQVSSSVRFERQYALQKITFKAVDGTAVTHEQAAVLFKSLRPVLLVPSGTKLPAYFQQIMKRKTLVAYVENLNQ